MAKQAKVAPPSGRARRAATALAEAPVRTPPAGAAPDARQPLAHTELLKAFGAQLAQYDPTGALVARSDDLLSMARAAAQHVLDTAPTWVEHLGAFHDTEGVQQLLARRGAPISRQAVHKRRGLLALTTGSGQVVYPAFQFDGPRPVPGLAAVLDALPEAVVSRWTVASWLVSPDAELGGARPLEVLRDQGPEGQLAVLDAARRWSAQLGV